MALLELREVTKSFDEVKVVDGFDLKVHKGELRCLLGPNGAGKTTAMDLITGRQRVSQGTVLFDTQVVTTWSEQARARAGIGRKFQIPAVFRDLTVRENLEVAYARHTNPFSNMLKFRERADQTKFSEVVELVNLKDRLAERAAFLSHGETQWLEIGMVLMQDPQVLLMDEPTAGMTELETRRTGELFNRLKGQHTLLVVEHDMAFVREIADRITVMHMGRTMAEGTLEDIENHEGVREVYLGKAGFGHA